jgi:hypothetical protein
MNLLFVLFYIYIYSGPSKVERFETQIKIRKSKNESGIAQHRAARAHLTRKSNKLKIEPPLGTDCVQLSRVHCVYIYIYIERERERWGGVMLSPFWLVHKVTGRSLRSINPE